jgi:hypothetical protein
LVGGGLGTNKASNKIAREGAVITLLLRTAGYTVHAPRSAECRGRKHGNHRVPVSTVSTAPPWYLQGGGIHVEEHQDTDKALCCRCRIEKMDRAQDATLTNQGTRQSERTMRVVACSAHLGRWEESSEPAALPAQQRGIPCSRRRSRPPAPPRGPPCALAGRSRVLSPSRLSKT